MCKILFEFLIQAEDADLENNSVVVYSLDPSSVDSKYFIIGLTGGEIQTKMSASQMTENSQKNYFIFRVSCFYSFLQYLVKRFSIRMINFALLIVASIFDIHEDLVSSCRWSGRYYDIFLVQF